MISSIITPVRWYNTYQEQSRFEIDSEICEYELISDKTRLLPFQFKRPASGYLINKWFLRKACTEPTTNLIDSNNSLFTNDTGYWTKTGAGFVNGKLSIIGSSSSIQRSSILTPGKYYDIEIVVSSLSNGYEVEVSTNSGVIQTIDSTGTFKIKYLALTGDSFFKIETTSGGAFDFMVFESIQIKEYVGFSTGIGDVELPIADLSLINIGTQDAIIYFGTPFNFQLPCGNYYMMLTTTDDTIYYSEVISVKDFIPSHSPYTLIEWFNNCDLSDVIYQNINSYAYKNRMYIDGPISKPEYPFKEDGVEDGNSDYNVTFQKWEKKEILTVAKCPDFIVDSLTAMKLHDTIEVTKPLRKKQLSVLPAYEIKSMEFEVIPVMNDFANNVEIKMLLNDKVIDSTCCTNITVSACRACNYTVDEAGVLTGDLYFGELFSEDFGLYNITTVATDNITGVGTLEYIMNGDRSSIYPIGTKIYVAGVAQTSNIGFHEVTGIVYFVGTNKTHLQWSGMTTDVGPASGTIKAITYSAETVPDDTYVCTNTDNYVFVNGELWAIAPSYNTDVIYEDATKYHLAVFVLPNTYIKIKVIVDDGILTDYYLTTVYFANNSSFSIDLLKADLPFAIPTNGTVSFEVTSYDLSCSYGETPYHAFTYES
jgi:hypothetical protein